MIGFLKTKLATKISLIYISLGLLTLIAINLVWFLPSLEEIKQNAALMQLEIAKRGAKEIEAFLFYKIEGLNRLTYFLGNQENKKLVLENFLRKDQAFFEISLINYFGQEEEKASQFQIFSTGDLLNQSESEYFKKAIKGETYIGDVLFSENAEPFLIVSFPIYSSQKQITGVLAGKLNLRETWQVVSELKLGQVSRAYLVDQNGKLIADPDPSLVLKNISTINLPIVKKVISEKKIVDGLGSESSYLNQQNQKVLGVAVPLESVPWAIIMERPEAEAYSQVNKKFAVFIFLLVLGGVCLILVGQWLGYYVTEPLRKLSQGAKIIGSGNLNYKLNIKTGDETEQLASAFNEMTDQLKDSHFFLEKKVEERTEELKEQRDQLVEGAKKLIQRDQDLNELRGKEQSALAEAKEARIRAEESRIATLNILEDIDEARQAQEMEKNKVQGVIRSLTDGLILLDRENAIDLFNPQAEKMINERKENVVGKKLDQLDSVFFKKISEIFHAKKGILNKEEIVLGDIVQGKVIEISSAQVLGALGEDMGQILVLHDVTREKAVERTKSEFVSIAAHQLRTPLSAIKWSLRLILDKDLGTISSEQEEILEKGYESNERMIRLVNDLLNLARIEEGRFIYKVSSISLVELTEQLIGTSQPLMDKKKMKFAFNKPSFPCFINVDREKIALVIQNLIENAINYSPIGSLVTISIGCDKMGITFSIKDQGIGIPKNQQARIFTKFYRGNNALRMETEGSGLGLFICKNIIEAHGGRIWFESEEGKGASFYFMLPKTAEAAEMENQTTPSSLLKSSKSVR